MPPDRHRSNRALHPLQALLVACAQVLAGAARAGDGDPQGLTEMTLEQLLEVPVVTASRFDQDRRDAPASMTVLTARDIADHGWRTLAEALRTVPGIHVTDDRNYASVGARGIALPGDYSNRLIVLIDGHRMNDPFYHSADVQEYFPLPMEAIERIEIVNGPGSTLYGGDALLAVINVISRDGSGDPSTTLRASVGTQRHVEAGVAHEGRHGTWRLNGAAAVRETAGDASVRSPGLPSIHDADGLSATQAFFRASRGRFTLVAGTSSRAKEVPTGSYFTLPRKGTRTVDARSFVEGQWQQRIGRGDIHAQLSLDSSTYAGRYLFDESVAQDGSDPRIYADSLVAEWARSQIDYSFSAGSRVHVTVGAELERALRIDEGRGDVVSQEIRDVGASSTSYGVHAQGEVRLARRALFVAGANWSDLGPAHAATSHRIALILRPTPRTTFKLMRDTAFRGANGFERSVAAGGLRTEGIVAHEMALSSRVSHALELGASAYHQRIKDVIAREPAPSLAFRNHGSMAVRGLQWSLDGAWGSGWRMRVNGSFQRSSNEQGERLANSPSATLNAAVVIPVRPRRSTLALETAWLGSRRTLSGASTGSSLHATAQWRERNLAGVEGLDLALRVTNALDEDGWVTGGEEHVQDVIPSPSRRAMLSLSWTF
jgi:iron complex outermembrane receptor protein